MTEAPTKVPVEVKKAERPVSTHTEWRPFESLRREIDRLFDDFRVGSWRSPFDRVVVRRRSVLAHRDQLGQSAGCRCYRDG